MKCFGTNVNQNKTIWECMWSRSQIKVNCVQFKFKHFVGVLQSAHGYSSSPYITKVPKWCFCGLTGSLNNINSNSKVNKYICISLDV